MEKLIFDRGEVSYQVGETGEVIQFNPADMLFAGKIAKLFDRIDSLQQQYHGQMQLAKDGLTAYKVAQEANEKMMTEIDAVIGEGKSKAIFGGVACYAISQGLPIWANLMVSIVAEMDDAVVREQEKTNPTLEKYLKKYQGQGAS